MTKENLNEIENDLVDGMKKLEKSTGSGNDSAKEQDPSTSRDGDGDLSGGPEGKAASVSNCINAFNTDMLKESLLKILAENLPPDGMETSDSVIEKSVVVEKPVVVEKLEVGGDSGSASNEPTQVTKESELMAASTKADKTPSKKSPNSARYSTVRDIAQNKQLSASPVVQHLITDHTNKEVNKEFDRKVDNILLRTGKVSTILP